VLDDGTGTIRAAWFNRVWLANQMHQGQALVLSGNVLSGAVAAEFTSKLKGYRFHTIRRQGKYIVCGLESSSNSAIWLVIHLRMTGKLHLVNATEATGRHTRLVLYLDQGVALHFDDPRKFGRVVLTGNPCDVTDRLGPDALDIAEDDFLQRLGNFRRNLKPLLLDQSFICGIGNIYADEILFRARLHPLTPLASLSLGEKKTLYRAIISVLAEAVAEGGANIDGVFKAGKFVTSVYGRDRRSCKDCGSIISKIRVAQRGTHFCPRCQPLLLTS